MVNDKPGILDRIHPVFYMLIVVASFSATPILFKLGNADGAPYLFTGIFQISVTIGVGGVLLCVKPGLLIRRKALKEIGSGCVTWLMLMSAVGYCWLSLFAIGLLFVDASIVAVLYNTWPLFLILLLALLFRGTKRYERITWGTLIYGLLAVAGVGLVILSHNVAPNPFLAIGSGLAVHAILWGSLLAVMAAIGQAAGAGGTLKLGTLIAAKHTHTEKRETGEIVFAMVMTCMGHIISGGVLCVIGLVASESISLHQISFAVMGGIFVNTVGTFSFRLGNLKTKDLGVNAIVFATPLVVLIWLWAFSTLDVSHVDYLVIGAMGIVASNLLLNVKASERIAYKALVACLWLFGAITYFSDGYVTDIPLELPVTVFILVLSFRVDRLVRRTGHEEEWMFDLFHKLESLDSEKQTDRNASRALRKALNALMRIDKHRTTSGLASAYEDMVRHLIDAGAHGIPTDEIREVRRLVDKMAHSQQQGSRLGEIVAIALTGALIILGLLVFNGNREIYGEIASFLLSSVVAFLFFNIVDLQRDRKDRTMIVKHGHYMVNFEGFEYKETHQRVSMVASAVIVIVFVCLFFIRS